MGRQKQHSERVYQVIGKPEPGALVAGYVRYSSDMQDPATIITQKRRIEEYAESNDWHIIRWYEEPEQSAKFEEIEKRPVFAEMLAAAGREFQVALCYLNDRWARNAAVAFVSLEQLRSKRVWWATADGQWDIDRVQQDGFDVAFVVDTQMNAAYLRRVSKRAIDGKEDRARDGYRNGQVPFGYVPPEYPKPPDGAPSTWKPPRMPVRRDPANFPALAKIGELAAQGRSDAAIADELVEYVSVTPRFGERPLTKDTIASIRRMWFPREFAPGCGHGTIETPSGKLVEGRHEAAWSYELWQKMVKLKDGQYHRPRAQVSRHAHEFSRILCCAACGQPLRVDSHQGVTYYRDTSRMRRLPCTAFGCLSVASGRVLGQFDSILRSIRLPAMWRETVSQQCREIAQTEGIEWLVAHRTDLEAEQRRLVIAFTKGYLTEDDVDLEVERIRAELLAMPLIPAHRSAQECSQAAITAGETLGHIASHWESATVEQRREMVWSLLGPNGLVYDLQRQGIAGLIPRADVQPALALGLHERWELRDHELWLRDEYIDACIVQSDVEIDSPPYRSHRLTAMQRQEALALVQSGMSPQTVAERLHVSYWVIFRLMKRNLPERTTQRRPKLTPEQETTARELLSRGQSLRQVGSHFGVSYGAIWRMVRCNAEKEASKAKK